jgi:ribose transport system substrate-binding protein
MSTFTTRGLPRVFLAVLACACLALATGCGGDDSSSSGDSSSSSGSAASGGSGDSSGKGFTIGLVSAGDCTNAVVCAHQKSFEAAVKAMGATPLVLESPFADLINNQIKNMDEMRVKGVDAAAIWVQDDKALRAPIKRAIDAGIPVFTMESYDPIDGVTAQFLEGRSWQGIQSAEEFCKHANGKSGTVLWGDWHLPNPGLTILKKNFEPTLADCSQGNLKVRYWYNKTDDVAGGRAGAEPAVQQTNDAVGIYGYNDPTAIGGALAAQQQGKRDGLLVTGYNLGDDGVQGIERGQINDSWDFRAAVAGQEMVRSMVDYLSGKNKNPAKVTMIWPKCYTKATISQLPSLDDQLAKISAGTDLGEEDPDLIDTGDAALTKPTHDVPGCE